MAITTREDVRLPQLPHDADDETRKLFQALYDQFRDTNKRLWAIESTLGMAARTVPASIIPSIGVYPVSGTSATHYIEATATGTASASAGTVAECDTGTAQVTISSASNVAGNANATLNATVQGTGTATTQAIAAHNGTGDASLLLKSLVTAGTATTGLYAQNGAGIVGWTITAITGGESVSDLAGFQQMTEMTAPTAGGANTVRIYAVDNGAGKTQLMAKFNTGAAQQIAIQP